MNLDLEALKRELEEISKWPSRLDHRLRLYDDEGYIREFIIKAPECIAALIAEVEQANELIEDRWNESTDFGLQLIKENKTLQEKLHQAEKRIRELERRVSSAIWLGCRDHRMRLDQKQVKELVKRLNNWLESGSFLRQKVAEARGEGGQNGKD